MDNDNKIGYDEHGTPVDHKDQENKIIWVYQGKGEDGCDHWMGIPIE